MPRPLGSTLFPYTTLFRSLAGRAVLRAHVVLLELPILSRAQAGASRPGVGASQRPVALRDRKSTRLNSSHVEISYAVFCLKKKKNTDRVSMHDIDIEYDAD